MPPTDRPAAFPSNLAARWRVPPRELSKATGVRPRYGTPATTSRGTTWQMEMRPPINWWREA